MRENLNWRLGRREAFQQAAKMANELEFIMREMDLSPKSADMVATLHDDLRKLAE